MAPRVDHGQLGRTCAQHRRPDRPIAARIHTALGDARTVVNAGAGTGSCEPPDRWVLAVEPSATMRAQRPAAAAPAIAGRAEALPLDDDAVDAARLDGALRSGAWDAEHGDLRGRASFAGSLRLMISEPG